MKHAKLSGYTKFPNYQQGQRYLKNYHEASEPAEAKKNKNKQLHTINNSKKTPQIQSD